MRLFWCGSALLDFMPAPLVSEYMYKQIKLKSVKEAEWPPFGKVLLTRLTLIMSYTGIFGSFPFRIRGQDFDSDSTSSVSLLTFYYFNCRRHCSITYSTKGT